MKSTIEEETDYTIYFLDIAITKTNDSLTFDIYRKPTTTDTIIPKHSCHSPEHKSAAMDFLNKRRDNYSSNDENKTKETNIIKQILHINKYDTTVLQKKNPPKVHKHHKPHSQPTGPDLLT
jgi:hypothetical protein